MIKGKSPEAYGPERVKISAQNPFNFKTTKTSVLDIFYNNKCSLSQMFTFNIKKTPKFHSKPFKTLQCPFPLLRPFSQIKYLTL